MRDARHGTQDVVVGAFARTPVPVYDVRGALSRIRLPCVMVVGAWPCVRPGVSHPPRV